MPGLNKRIAALEATLPKIETGRAFLWVQGQSLNHALAFAGLTLGDKPLTAIRLNGVVPGEIGPRIDPLYERDKHLVD